MLLAAYTLGLSSVQTQKYLSQCWVMKLMKAGHFLY